MPKGQVGGLNNPTGKGGFGDHPENRSDGRWSKENSFTYWYNYFKQLTPIELESWINDNGPHKRSVAADLAYRRIVNAQKDLKEFQEVADRSEGKAVQNLKAEITDPRKEILERYMGAASAREAKANEDGPPQTDS